MPRYKLEGILDATRSAYRPTRRFERIGSRGGPLALLATIFGGFVMKAKDALEQDRRGFLQMAGVATATFTAAYSITSSARASAKAGPKVAILSWNLAAGSRVPA